MTQDELSRCTLSNLALYQHTTLVICTCIESKHTCMESKHTCMESKNVRN